LGHNHNGGDGDALDFEFDLKSQERVIHCEIYVRRDEEYQYEGRHREDTHDFQHVRSLQLSIWGITYLSQKIATFGHRSKNGEGIWLWLLVGVARLEIEKKIVYNCKTYKHIRHWPTSYSNHSKDIDKPSGSIVKSSTDVF